MGKPRVVILGAGFAGLELATLLSQAFSEHIDVKLIDKGEGFVFGFSKLDVMFGRAQLADVLLPYARFVKPGVTFLRETVTAIDPAAKRVTTNAGTHEADHLVIALGADYDVSSTPGVKLGENEFYSVAGAQRQRALIPKLNKGHVVVGVCGAPYKCPPAPSECALMMHDELLARGVRGDCTITMTNPLPSPVPPSPETSKALIAAFAERKIDYLPGRKVTSFDEAGRKVLLDDGRELPCDLFLGVPKNRAPDVVVATGLTENGWVTVNQRTLETKFPGVYAVGDLANAGTPKAGVFAETAARTVAMNLIAVLRGEEANARNPGVGSCYIEFGGDRVARVDVDFFSAAKPTGTFFEPSRELAADKKLFSSTRRSRWFA
jgi:sulfide:quinone oxidoreductase